MVTPGERLTRGLLSVTVTAVCRGRQAEVMKVREVVSRAALVYNKADRTTLWKEKWISLSPFQKRYQVVTGGQAERITESG